MSCRTACRTPRLSSFPPNSRICSRCGVSKVTGPSFLLQGNMYLCEICSQKVDRQQSLHQQTGSRPSS